MSGNTAEKVSLMRKFKATWGPTKSRGTVWPTEELDLTFWKYQRLSGYSISSPWRTSHAGKPCKHLFCCQGPSLSEQEAGPEAGTSQVNGVSFQSSFDPSLYLIGWRRGCGWGCCLQITKQQQERKRLVTSRAVERLKDLTRLLF